MLRIALVLVLFALPLSAQEEIVADLSQRRVSINANFDGSEILIFGAVKRMQPSESADPLEVIVTVAGPQLPVAVRRKTKRFGIWVNTDVVEVDAAPSFYAVSSSKPLGEILSSIDDLRYKISIPRAIRSVGAPMNIQDTASFTQALIRIRTNNGTYQERPNSVTLHEETLFRTSVELPANLIEGAYETTLYLTRGRQVVSSYTTTLDVRKVGLEKFLFNLAHERPLIYGIMSLAIAIAAGWTASAVFRYLRA